FAAIAVNQLHRQQSDEGQGNQGGPEGEALKSNNFKGASQQDFWQRRGPAQAEDQGEPETQKQWHKPLFTKAAEKDKGQRQHHCAPGNDPVVQAPLNVFQVVVAAGVGNRRSEEHTSELQSLAY